MQLLNLRSLCLFAAGDEDGEAIRMAFSKKQVEDRKAWLSAYVPGTYLDQRAPRIPYKEFIHKARADSLLSARQCCAVRVPVLWAVLCGHVAGHLATLSSCCSSLSRPEHAEVCQPLHYLLTGHQLSTKDLSAILLATCTVMRVAC